MHSIKNGWADYVCYKVAFLQKKREREGRERVREKQGEGKEFKSN